MLNLLRVLLDILRFRASPRAVPYSVTFLLVFLVLNVLLKLVDFQVYAHGLILLALTFGWLALFVFVCLWLGHKRDRFVQTYSAILGTLLITNALFRLFTLCIPAPIMQWVFWVFLVWNLAVLSHIMRYALDTKVRYAVLLVLSFEVVRFGLLWFAVGVIA